MARSAQTETVLLAELEKAVNAIPGNNYEFTQPVQMRMNELIAGVRAEVAIKVYGDDMEQLAQIGSKIEAVAEYRGSADVALEQITGLPLMTITPNVDALSRYGWRSTTYSKRWQSPLAVPSPARCLRAIADSIS